MLATDGFVGNYWSLAHEAFDWFRLGHQKGVVHTKEGIEWRLPNAAQWNVFRRVLVLNQSIDVMFAILAKVELITNLWQQQALRDNDWEQFVQSDIHAFHVEMRSAFDTIALLLSELMPELSNVDSFREYRDMTKYFNSKKKRIAQPAYREFVARVDWFDDLRDMRDQMMHSERDAWVRWRADGHILFGLERAQQLKPHKLDANSSLRCFLWHNLILFRPYAGYYLGRFVYLLNDLAAILRHELDVQFTTWYRWVPMCSVVPAMYVKESLGVLTSAISQQSRYGEKWESIRWNE